MDADSTPAPRRRRTLVAAVLAAAGLALAIPVSGAFAGSDDSSGASGNGANSARSADRDGHRGDCPKDRDRGGDSSGAGVDQSTEL